jgi:uncharacterized protein involved in exopolysaccharide biosynthesis
MSIPYDINRVETFDFRSHYELAALKGLQSIFRHRWLIAQTIICAIVLAALLVSVLPRRYSAEALVQPQLFSKAENGTAIANIDGASFVASEAALIGSAGMATAVVKRLGLDKDTEHSNSRLAQTLAALRAAILPETVFASPIERSAHRLRDRLNVQRDTRSYLITVGYTADSPQQAAAIANAFALEYVNAKAVQRLSEAVSVASRELTQASTIYGENHPSLARANSELSLAQERLQAAIERPVGSNLTPSEGITFAVPSSAPSSPNGVAILGLGFLLGLLAGIALALFKDRHTASKPSDSPAKP